MKKTLGFVLILLMIIGGTLSVAAQGMTCRLEAESVTAVIGEEITIPVMVKEHSGFSNFSIALDYDKDSLELLSINKQFEEEMYLCGTMASVNTHWMDENGNSYGFITGAFAGKMTEEGVLFTATFRVKEKFSEETVVTPIVISMRNNEASFFFFENLQTEVVAGVVLEGEIPEITQTPEVSETPEVTNVPQVSVQEIFEDVYQDWYTSYVQYVYDNALMTGIKGTSKFAPNDNITKAQVAQVLYNMEGQPVVEEQKVFSELTDVYAGEWYGNAVAWAYSSGVVTGDTNAKKFFPNADVTREQLALMMYRYAEFKEYDVSSVSNLEGLKNAENTSNWAIVGVKWAVGTGLISGIEKNGVKDLAPQGNASRAQVAAILQRFCMANN